MGFLSKAFKKVKKQIQPGNMIARDMGPGNMPRRPDIFGGNSFLFGRKPDMTSIRMPQKRGGGFGNLGEAIRRLQEKRGGDMGMPRMEGRPINQYMGSPGGTPGFYDNMRENMSPGQRLEQMPTLQESRQALARKNPIARRDPSALERIPMGNMPDFSQIDMSQLDIPTLPREISQMNLPQMPEGLPSMEEIETAPRMPQMRMGDMQPRMMMAEGDEVFPDLTGDGKVTQADILKGRGVYAEGDEVKSFADYQPEGSLKGTFFDYIPDGYQVSSFLMDKFGQEAAQDPTIREMFEKEFKAARMAGKDVFEFMGKPYNTKTLEEVEGMRYGGEMERFQEGGEIDAMLGGMDSGEQEAMGELEQMAPEMEMIDQLVNMVVQMIQQGASEEEVIGFLREQGLDDEDIGTVLQLVSEMAETEEVAAQNEIGSDLEQLG
jgi:hypothetical protein